MMIKLLVLDKAIYQIDLVGKEVILSQTQTKTKVSDYLAVVIIALEILKADS